jgi:hypothetical protein
VIPVLNNSIVSHKFKPFSGTTKEQHQKKQEEQKQENVTLKILEEISQQLNSVQKAQAHTRGEIQGLRTEFINRITRGGRE